MEEILQIIIGYLLADFIMGIYHWIKDTYFSPTTAIIGAALIKGSRLHHTEPRQIIHARDGKLFFDSAWSTAIWMGPLIIMHGMTPLLSSLYLTICINDIAHKYAHMTDKERPIIPTMLQKFRVLQSYEEHHQHHISPHEINYCPITPYLNGVLEKINFWRSLELVIDVIFKIKPRQ
jgi:hypothetical protein